MSQRTYQHRVTAASVAVIVLIAGLALYFFLSREAALSLVALLLIGIDVVMIERVIHTEYVLTDDGNLVIDRGRFARPTVIPLSGIVRMEQRRHPFLGMHYVLIEYGAGKYASIVTDNEAGLISEVSKRQKEEM